jgi:hypothetical protein
MTTEVLNQDGVVDWEAKCRDVTEEMKILKENEEKLQR